MKPIMKRLIPSNPTYDQLAVICEGVAETIVDVNKRKPDVVIGVARGGMMPAVHISHCLHVPLIPVSYSSKSGNGDNVNHQNVIPELSGKRILIVDDIADSGKTLQELVDVLGKTNDVETAVMYYKHTNDVHDPTYYGYSIDDTFGWVNFPWEID